MERLLSNDGTLVVPAASGSWRCSDQHGKSSVDGLFATPGFAGLRGRRRASRAARRVQVSENSCNCSDSCARSFVPHRRVISRDSDLHALGVSISSSSCLARVSVSRVPGELSASFSLCGRALVCESGALCRVCVKDARQSVVGYGTDLIDHKLWKHGHEAAGETKVLSLSSGSRDGCSFVDIVLRGAALEQYLRGAPKGTKVEAWEGRIFTCSRPRHLGCFGR